MSVAKKIPLRTLVDALLSKTKPEVIYKFSGTRKYNLAAWALGSCFIGYGVTFADWSLDSRDKLDTELPEGATFWDKVLVFSGSTGIVTGLCLIPMTIGAIALYMPNRMVTAMRLLPAKEHMVELTLNRNVPLAAKKVVVPLKQLNAKNKIFTGQGDNGMEDKGSMSIFIRPEGGSKLSFYMLDRGGECWGTDARVLDVLLCKRPIKEVEARVQDTKKMAVTETSSQLDEILSKQHGAKLTGNKVEDIVGMMRK